MGRQGTRVIQRCLNYQIPYSFCALQVFLFRKNYIVEKVPGGSVEDRPPEKREIIYLFAKDAYRILLKINQDNWRKISQLQMMNTDIDLVLLDFIFKIYWENNYCQILLDILSSEYVEYVARHCSIFYLQNMLPDIARYYEGNPLAKRSQNLLSLCSFMRCRSCKTTLVGRNFLHNCNLRPSNFTLESA